MLCSLIYVLFVRMSVSRMFHYSSFVPSSLLSSIALTNMAQCVTSVWMTSVWRVFFAATSIHYKPLTRWWPPYATATFGASTTVRHRNVDLLVSLPLKIWLRRGSPCIHFNSDISIAVVDFLWGLINIFLTGYKLFKSQTYLRHQKAEISYINVQI